MTPREDDIRQVAFVAFLGGSDSQPTIQDLRILLRSIYKVAPKYNLLKVFPMYRTFYRPVL